MKRKIFLLLAIILLLSLAMTACKQGDIGEAKAKEIALDNINRVFQTNQTEASVTREQMGCYPEQRGAMATTGDGELAARWLYIVDVPSIDKANYQAYVVASTGEVLFLSQSESNIILTDEQEEQAAALLAAEPDYGREHEKTFTLLKDACREWAVANLGDEHPILLDAARGRRLGAPARESYSVDYYVVTKDARVYCITMYWPSLQVLNINVENPK
ncbi:MAG: hypothetical protein PHW41_03550 [Eubacteriales bacterium]|nr:hypothetical protein [Eubacteriales bacterium]